MGKWIKNIFFLVLFMIAIFTLLTLTKIVSTTQNCKTIILNKNLFENNFSKNSLKNSLHVDNINTIPLDNYSTCNNWIDDTHILISRNQYIYDKSMRDNLSDNKNVLAVLDLTTNSVSPLSHTNKINFNVSISPDRTKILYTKFNKDSCISSFYDIHSEESSEEIIDSSVQCWLPDSSGFIVVSQTGNIQLYDMSKKNLSTIVTADKYSVPYENCVVNISKDGGTLFISNRFLYEEKGKTIYCVNLSNNKIKKIHLSLTDIYEYEILNKNTLILSGILNKKQGLYSYDINTDSISCLAEGPISIFTLSSQGSDIAYISNGELNPSLYTAKLINNKLTSVSMLYAGLLDYKSMHWNKTGEKLIFTDWSPENRNKLHIVDFK